MKEEASVGYTRESIKALLDKVDKLRFEYLEKDREAQVLAKRMEDAESAHASILATREQEVKHL